MFGHKHHGPVDLRVIAADFDDVFGDRIRVHQSHRPFSRAGQIILVKHGGKKLLGVARGARRSDPSTIQLDQRSRDKLGIRSGENAKLSFESAGWIREFWWAWRATDAMPRIQARLGVIALALGLFGALLAGWSIWLAYQVTC